MIDETPKPIKTIDKYVMYYLSVTYYLMYPRLIHLVYATNFYSDNFGKTMTMTAISKGFRRIMKLLDFQQENKVESKTMWSNEFKTNKSDERIGELIFSE